MNIFDVANLIGFELENNSGHYFTLAGRLVPPKEAVATTANYQPIATNKLGIDFCKFKYEYNQSPEMRAWFDDGLIVATPITGAAGIVCSWENGVGTASPTPTASGATWIRTPDGTVFVYDNVRSAWLGQGYQKYSTGRGFGLAQNIALFGEDGTPTSQTPIRIPRNEMLVGITLESESTDSWTLELRDFTSKTLITGATFSTTSGNKSGSTNTLGVALDAGQEIEVYLSSATPISFPRAHFFTRERG